MSDLTDLIEKLVLEKTFSVDGVKAIEKLRKTSEQVEAKLTETLDQLKISNEEKLMLHGVVEKEKTKVIELEAKIEELSKPQDYRELSDSDLSGILMSKPFASLQECMRSAIAADRALQRKPKTIKVRARFWRTQGGQIQCSVEGTPFIDLDCLGDHWLGEAFEMELPDTPKEEVIDLAVPSGGSVAGPEEDCIEYSYWRFDARKKGYGRWKHTPMSERDAFKAEARLLMSESKSR